LKSPPDYVPRYEAAESGDGTRERVFTVLMAQAGAEQHVWVNEAG